MARGAKRSKQRDQATESLPAKTSLLDNPFLTISGNREKHKSISTIFNTAETGKEIEPFLIADLRNIATSPISKAASAEARQSPSYKASQRAKMRQRKSVQSLESSPPLIQNPLMDCDDEMNNTLDFDNGNQSQPERGEPADHMQGIIKPTYDTIKDESESDADSNSDSSSDASSSSSESLESGNPTLTLPANRQPVNPTSSKTNTIHRFSQPDHSSIKRTLSNISGPSSSSASASPRDVDSDASTAQPNVKRIKTNPLAEPRSSTVASRNPLPPEVLSGTTKPRPAAHALDISESSSDDTKSSINRTKYPQEVLSAACSLETVLPPYLTTATISDTANRLDTEPLRPPVGSDDTKRLVTILKSARKLIIHLSVKKLNENETDLQTQVLRITKDREQTLMVMQGEVRRLLANIGRR